MTSSVKKTETNYTFFSFRKPLHCGTKMSHNIISTVHTALWKLYGAHPATCTYKWYRVFPGGKLRPECAADHSPPSSATFMEE